MFCVHCGEKLSDMACFCTRCGKSTEGDDLQQAQAAPKPTASLQPQPAALSQIQIPPQHGKSQPFLRKGCTDCQTESDFNLMQDEAARLIGTNAAYYLRQFSEIQSQGERHINWASFWIGIYHAAYRNLWREYLQMCYIPCLIAMGAGVIILFSAATLSLGLMALSMFVAVGGMIGFIVRQIQFSLRFNAIYMHHINEMLQNKRPAQPGTNPTAVLICVGILFGGNILCSMIANAIGLSMLL